MFPEFGPPRPEVNLRPRAQRVDGRWIMWKDPDGDCVVSESTWTGYVAHAEADREWQKAISQVRENRRR